MQEEGHRKNLKIRLWMLFLEEEDGCTSPEVPSMRRVLSDPCHPAWEIGNLGDAALISPSIS